MGAEKPIIPLHAINVVHAINVGMCLDTDRKWVRVERMCNWVMIILAELLELVEHKRDLLTNVHDTDYGCI
jgi:hypothetical protein